MQRARETQNKVCNENKTKELTQSIDERTILDARQRKVVMMSPRTRERRRNRYADERDSSDDGIQEEKHPMQQGSTPRAATLAGLKKIKQHLASPGKQPRKGKKTPNCTFCVGNDFCDPHMEFIFMESIVDELIAFTQPVYQSKIPLPDHAWREKYPLVLKENATAEDIIFASGKMKIIYPLVCFNQRIIFSCDICLKTLSDPFAFNRHTVRCNIPVPGVCVYEEKGPENLTVHRVDGERSKNYCRRLCTIGKLFLEHKTLFYDVEPFLFYVLHTNGKFVGYFSKEKTSKYNLSCIVVLPIFQGKGFGTFMIDISYCLSISRKETGTPEKPLSKQGLASYQTYWRYTVYHEMITRQGRATLIEISRETGICVNDLVYGLELLGFLKRKNNEYYIQVENKKFKEIRRCKKECFVK